MKPGCSFFIIIAIVISFIACNAAGKISGNKQNTNTMNDKVTITGLLVEKKFEKKNGQFTDFSEMYFRLSVDDYFIKFCESEVNKSELNKYLSEDLNIKPITLEIEYRKGNWDICDDNSDAQSRVGRYVVIHRIVK